MLSIYDKLISICKCLFFLDPLIFLKYISDAQKYRHGQIFREIHFESKSKIIHIQYCENLLHSCHHKVSTLGANIKISNGKNRLEIYLWNDIFETKFLIKLILVCDDH